MKTISLPQADGSGLAVRPHQLMCILCQLGAQRSLRRLKDKRLDAIFQVIRNNPRVPLRFTAYPGDKYNGTDTDSPCGVLFHMYQDEVIKSRLQSYPGKWERAMTGLGKLFDIAKFFPTRQGICWFDPASPPAWRGCPWAGKDYYERGKSLLKPLAADILPDYNNGKSHEVRHAIKAPSAAAVLESDVIRLFPNHLLFTICMYLQAETRRDMPVDHDNVWEPAEAMRRNPEIPVMLVPDHCMVCTPCGAYDTGGSGLCQVNALHMKPAEKISAYQGIASLAILRTLGVEFFEQVPAHRMLQLVKERMTPDHIAFTYGPLAPNYSTLERKLHDGLGFLDAYHDSKAVLRRVTRLLADPRVASLVPPDERQFVQETLAAARRFLREGKRRDAYMTLTETAFAHTWKQYMELIPDGYARLPKSIRREPAPVTAERTLTARRKGETEIYSCDFTTMTGRPCIAETGLSVQYDRDHLCVRFLCADANTSALKSDAHVGTELKHIGRRYDRRSDDAVMLVLQPDTGAGVLFSFVVNPRGIKLAERRSQGDGRIDSTWVYDSAWSASTRVEASMWRAELTIPFSALGVRGDRRHWKLNAHRFFRNSMLDHHSWSHSEWRFDDATQCGRLELPQRRGLSRQPADAADR